uniref:G_PROTEIN_RECEP_F1_2 domain-containing protein n=1 Tax=Heterorhabditis bacteriophora TaxID=37862 RepID=A0A1I7XSN7_HETBA
MHQEIGRFCYAREVQSIFRNDGILIFVQLVRHPFVEFFDFPLWRKCRTTVEWPTSSSSATSRVVLHGSASTMALSWLSAITKGRRHPPHLQDSRLRYEISGTNFELYDTFVPVVNLVFLATDPYKRFISDITFDRHQTQISRSRMYLELTQKGVDERRVVLLVTLVQSILAKAREVHLPVSVRAPFTMSLQHDIKVLSSNLFIFGVLLVCMFVLSLILLGQPGLTFLLLFTLIAGNALTSVVVIAFCYSYSMSGKTQVRAGMRIQYTFQATLLPVLFSCLVPVITYLALFAVDAPLIVHIWKVLLLNSAANLIHYLFFLPNMILLFSEYFSMGCTSFNCAECCCDMEDESSIYYIPTTGRAVHPEGIYHHASYTYSIPKSIVTAPPNYLAIAGPPSIGTTFVPEYNQAESHRGRQSRRSHRRNESSTAQFEITTPRVDRDGRRSRRRLSRDDSIYEAPPSPRLSSRSTSPQRVRISRDARAAPYFEEAINMHQKHWRPYVQPQPFMFYSGPTFPQRR